MFTESRENRLRREREEQMKKERRLPPGQALTLKWPVLHSGDVPSFNPEKWDFKVFGAVENSVRWSFHEFMNLPKIKVKSDFHCVTRWSRFDNVWEGIGFLELIKHVRLSPEAKHVMVHGESGYTANVPLLDLMRPDVLFAYKNNEETLTPEHGWPLRLVVPHLYAWKSVKWVRTLEFLPETQPGFWEQNGYHIYGDPFREQRYDDD